MIKKWWHLRQQKLIGETVIDKIMKISVRNKDLCPVCAIFCIGIDIQTNVICISKDIQNRRGHPIPDSVSGRAEMMFNLTNLNRLNVLYIAHPVSGKLNRE